MTWAPGQSGNPGGRPRLAQLIRKLATNDSEEAYQTVVALMRSADKDSTRLAAAIAVLKVAGVPMSAEVNITVTERAETPLAAAPTDALVSVAGLREGTIN